MSSKTTLLVVGGSGMLGQCIVKRARLRGWNVLALSRGARGVGALKMDILSSLQPSKSGPMFTYARPVEDQIESLSTVTDIVHATGSLLEWQKYKYLLGKAQFDTRVTANSDTASSYERMNRDTLYATLALAYHEMPNLKSVSFISAATDLLPFPLDRLLDARYLSSKRSAENMLRNVDTGLSKVVKLDEDAKGKYPANRYILRPGFMFSDSAPLTLPIAATLQTMRSVKHNLPDFVRMSLARPPAQPLSVDTVSDALVNLIESEAESTTIEVQDIVSTSQK